MADALQAVAYSLGPGSLECVPGEVHFLEVRVVQQHVPEGQRPDVADFVSSQL